MKCKAKAKIIGKDSTEYTAKNGIEKKAFRVNISQENGKSIDTLSVSEDIFNTLIEEGTYLLEIESRKGMNGIYLKVLSATLIN